MNKPEKRTSRGRKIFPIPKNNDGKKKKEKEKNREKNVKDTKKAKNVNFFVHKFSNPQVPQLNKAELVEWRKSHLGKSLSLSYDIPLHILRGLWKKKKVERRKRKRQRKRN